MKLETSTGLKMIYVAAIDQVDRVDEELSTPHRLDEIVRSSHLGHEFNKELRTTVGEDTLQ
jgi:hypothetical protein